VALRAVQMKEHLKGVTSSLVLIDDIHLHVLKAEGPQVQKRRSDDAHASIDKVWPTQLAASLPSTMPTCAL